MDVCKLTVFCAKDLEDDTTCEDSEDGEQAFGLDTKFIGAFRGMDAAKFVMENIHYRQHDVVCYEISDEEDFSASKIQTFDPEKNLMATYTRGGHQPGGAKYQEPCRFAPGEKALAVFQAPYYAVVPVKVIGPITPESERESWESNDTMVYYDSYEDYVNDWDDWHWDSVAVHPLVKLTTGIDHMTNTEVAPRIYLFPYHKLRDN